jgi:hypothetical protein
MVAFVSYILRFKNDNSAIGDVARDIEVDTNIKKTWGYTKLITYLIDMNVSERVYGILEEAKLVYTVRKLLAN